MERTIALGVVLAHAGNIAAALANMIAIVGEHDRFQIIGRQLRTYSKFLLHGGLQLVQEMRTG